jgi:glycosyltransferase involved in cell wall biosynthesis
MRRLRVLHAIHDFLPRHRAGSEIYVRDLARELSKRHDVFVVAAEYDPATPHGTIRWRACDGLPVIEIINNWEFERFEDSYSSARINRQLAHVLDATEPDVLHVHNLLNLSFDLPRLARERGIPTVATLHDYTLVCASGGQRVHVADAHVCDVIDTDRCSRCFAASPFHSQWAVGRLSRRPAARQALKLAGALRRRFSSTADRALTYLPAGGSGQSDMQRRLAYSRHVFEQVDLFVSPSAALASEFVRLGLDPRRIEVSDYGFPRTPSVRRLPARSARFGFVGTLAWHKGAHVFVEALKHVHGSFQASVYGDPAVFPQYTSHLRRLAAGLPVTFHGAFDREKLAEAYASVDVVVVPSLWPENSPLVIHEAFMHRAAVVGARIGGIPELVTDGVNGFLYEPQRAEDLAGLLQRFVNEPSLASRLACSAPAVKRIEDDASEWERRYFSVASVSSGIAEPA